MLGNRKLKKRLKLCDSPYSSSSSSLSSSLINNLDDGCLMHIFSFLSPSPDRYNTALVCHRWCDLACHPRLWLRVNSSAKALLEPGVFPTVETAVCAARPGDTILIAAGGTYLASNIQIKKPLCLIGGGKLPDDTTLSCLRGSDSALEFLSSCKLVNLTVKAELGCCLLHRSGRLTIDGCVLQCKSDPLDFLSCPIVCKSGGSDILTTPTTDFSSIRDTLDGPTLSPAQSSSICISNTSAVEVSPAECSEALISSPANANAKCSDVLISSQVECLEVLTTCSPTKCCGNGVTVSQTRIEGGAKAVLTSGNLSLRRVRVIYARTSLLFWFDVGCH